MWAARKEWCNSSHLHVKERSKNIIIIKIIGVKLQPMTVDGHIKKERERFKCWKIDVCRQTGETKRKDEQGGFHPKRRLKTQGNQSALKDRSKEIEIK